MAEGAGIADRDGKLVVGVEEGRREDEGEETKSRREGGREEKKKLWRLSEGSQVVAGGWCCGASP